MNSAKLNDWMQVVGIFALVASLIFVGLQMMQDRRLAAALVLVAANSVQMELAALISDNRDVWDRGLKAEELTEADETAFRAIAQAHFVRHLGIYQRLELLGLGSQEGIVRTYAFDLFQHPSLRRAFIHRHQEAIARLQYFGSTSPIMFGTEVAKVLEEMDEAPPVLDERKSFPF